MKKKEKGKEAAETNLTVKAVDQGELEAPLAESAAIQAQEIAQYQKEVDDLREESKRKSTSRSQKAAESKYPLLISGAVVSALTDKRFSGLPDNFATQLAMQAMKDAARLEISLPPMGPGKSWQDNFAIAGLKADDQFFRDLAASFLALKEQGFSVDGEGIWTKKLTASKAKKYMISRWKFWVAHGVKMESRAKEVEEKCGLSRKGFFKAKKELRNILKSPTQNVMVTIDAFPTQ